jgi:hypothetical protein
MRTYRVYYAGEPEKAVILDAKSADDAAYVFFANTPRNVTIFVEGASGKDSQHISIEELARKHADVPVVLNELGGQEDLLKATLVRDRNLRPAPPVVAAKPRSLKRHLLGLALSIGLVAMWAAIEAVVDESGINTRQIDLGEFQLDLPKRWSVGKDLRKENDVRFVKLDSDGHAIINLYVYPHGSGLVPRGVLDFFSDQLVPSLKEDGAIVVLGEYSEGSYYGRDGIERRFDVTVGASFSPHYWQVVRMLLPTQEIFVLIQFPTTEQTRVEAEAQRILDSIRPSEAPQGGPTRGGAPHGVRPQISDCSLMHDGTVVRKATLIPSESNRLFAEFRLGQRARATTMQ